jgi:hypothetical protein
LPSDLNLKENEGISLDSFKADSEVCLAHKLIIMDFMLISGGGDYLEI